MTILWCGGEDIDFPNGASIGINTSSSHFRGSPAYSRCSIYSSGGGRSTPFPGGSITSAWFSFRFYVNTPSTNNLIAGLIKDISTIFGLFIGVSTSSSSKLALFKYDGSTKTQLACESGMSLSSGLHSIDVSISNYGASASVLVYMDGALLISYSGDVTVSGVTNLGAVGIFGSYTTIEVSEIIVSDSDTRTFSLVTNAPSSAGTTDAWTAGAYTDVNETTINDSTVAYTNTADQNQQFNLTNLPAGTFSVKAQKIAARAAKSSDSSVGVLKLGINSGGTVNVDAGQSLTTAWATLERYMQTNPITSVAFTPEEVDAEQINLRSAA